MEELIQSSKNEEDVVIRPKMDEEEIVQADEVYPIKDETIIHVVDEVQDTVDLSGDNIAQDMEPPEITNLQVKLVEQPTTQLKVVNPSEPEQLEKPQSPSIFQETQKESMEIVVTQTSEKEIEKNQQKAIIKVTSSETTKPLVTSQTNEDDDDSLDVLGPINVDNMSTSEMMNIASVMQSIAHKKRLKEQRVEAETIQNAVDILSSLLPKTSTTHLTSPIRKLGQLVADASNQIKSLEEKTQTYAEKSHKKKYGEKLAKDIDTGKIALSHNKTLLGKAIEI